VPEPLGWKRGQSGSAGFAGAGGFGDKARVLSPEHLYQETRLPTFLLRQLTNPETPISPQCREWIAGWSEAILARYGELVDDKVSHRRKHTIVWEAMGFGSQGVSAFRRDAEIRAEMAASLDFEAGHRPKTRVESDGVKRLVFAGRYMGWGNVRKIVRKAMQRYWR
jgi:hypothetical protein